jgi:hypothetical protein
MGSCGCPKPDVSTTTATRSVTGWDGWSRGACYRRIRLRSLHVTISSGSVPVPDCTPSYVVATWIDVFDGGCGAATTRTTPSLAEGLEAEIQGKLHLDPAA